MAHLGSLFIISIRLILICLPAGLIAGTIGIMLRKKYSGHPRENYVVLGGMLAAATLGTAITFLVIGLLA